MEKITIPVKGMTCQNCVEKIESGLKTLNGVKSVKADLLENTTTIEFDPAKVNKAKINDGLEFLGYSAAGKSKKTIKQGIIYGLVPHIGCIGFVVASILGVTVATNLFKPLLMNRYFFHFLFLMSFAFATISSAIYLKKNNILSSKGVRKKKKYLFSMYGSTIGINLVLFLLIFPMLANVSPMGSPTGALVAVGDPSDLATLNIDVDIPCPGHAPLISGELKKIVGVLDVHFSFPDNFEITYDPQKVTKEQMLSIDVFEEYAPTVTDSSVANTNKQDSSTSGASSGGGCGGGCGGGSTCSGGSSCSSCGG